MVVFLRNGGKGGCVEMVFRMDEGEEIPSIDQLIKEVPEFFESEDEEGIDEFEEYTTLEQFEEENPGYFEEELEVVE